MSEQWEKAAQFHQFHQMKNVYSWFSRHEECITFESAANEDDDEIDDQVDEDTELVEEVEATEEILDESVV